MAVYQRFLLYKYFVANSAPTIITEGKSDIVYLAAAMRALAATIPTLVVTKDGVLRPNVIFVRHTEINKRILNLGGGTGGIAKFIHLHRRMKPYIYSPKAEPVIILIDNDDGAEAVFKAAKSAYNFTIDLRSPAPFYRLSDNLYLVKTPVGASAKGDTCIEDLFPAAVLATKLDGKSFDKTKIFGDASTYGKIGFAEKVVRPNASKIDFSGFESTLKGIGACISDYKTKVVTAAVSAAATGT